VQNADGDGRKCRRENEAGQGAPWARLVFFARTRHVVGILTVLHPQQNLQVAAEIARAHPDAMGTGEFTELVELLHKAATESGASIGALGTDGELLVPVGRNNKKNKKRKKNAAKRAQDRAAREEKALGEQAGGGDERPPTDKRQRAGGLSFDVEEQSEQSV
jgi:hypothetical protein